MDKKMFRVYAFFLVALVIIFPIYTGKIFSHQTNNEVYAMPKKCKPVLSVKPVFDQKKATVVIMMDDGWASQYSIAYPLLKKYGFQGSVAVVPSMVGKKNYMSYQQLQTLYIKAGWDLLNHTGTHPELPTLSKTDQTKEILDGSEWLDNNCFSRGAKVLVYPYGKFNNTTLSILQENHFLSARSEIETGVTKRTYPKYKVPVQIVSDALDFQFSKDFVDNAIARNGTAIFVYHRFSAAAKNRNDSMYTTQQHFEELLQYLAANKEKIEVLTYTQWLQKIK